MTEKQNERLTFLKARWCQFEFIQDYYGLDFTDRKDPLYRDYEMWLTTRKEVPYREGNRIDRYWLEMFLQTRGMLSKKWAATRLGMTEKSLDELLQLLDERGPIFRYHLSTRLIGEKFPDDLWEFFPALSCYTPDSHDSFCLRLHEEIEKWVHYKPVPEICRTAKALSETRFAKHWDGIANEPVSVKYEMWLDFKKWMTLPPDRTSLKTYSENQADLKPFIAGTENPVVLPLFGGPAVAVNQ